MPRRKTPTEVKKIENEVAKYVGKKLRHYRKKARYTLADAAKRTKTPVSTLSEYERGKYPTPVDRLRKLATLYEAPLSEFHLGTEDNMPADARQIADVLSEWDEKDRELVMKAVIQYLRNLKDLSQS